MTNISFWNGKKVFLTGHTGFKGSWLSLWLCSMGAQVTGFSLKPATQPSLFELCNIEQLITKNIIADVRDLESISSAMAESEAEIVIHLAAQPLVRESYISPVETYSTNIMGTVNLLESVRKCSNVKAVVNVTTDKCYDNKEWLWGYRESDPLGGYDPYSNSKACSELVTDAFRNSYFNDNTNNRRRVAIATARAGNVIGGGDWSVDRLIPDCINSIIENKIVKIRNPHSIRPWQHVLEPLNGYLTLAQKLYLEGLDYSGAWNFGPRDEDAKPVEWIVRELYSSWGKDPEFIIEDSPQLHEAQYLKLDCSKAVSLLNWTPKWDLQLTLQKIVEWNLRYLKNEDPVNICLDQIKHFQDCSS